MTANIVLENLKMWRGPVGAIDFAFFIVNFEQITDKLLQFFFQDFDFYRFCDKIEFSCLTNNA